MRIMPRAGLLVLVFGIVHAAVGVVTGWLAFAWLDPRVGNPAEAFRFSRAMQTIFIFQPTPILMLGVLWFWTQMKKWLGHAPVRQIICTGGAAALCSSLPLIGLSPALKGKDFYPG